MCTYVRAITYRTITNASRSRHERPIIWQMRSVTGLILRVCFFIRMTRSIRWHLSLRVDDQRCLSRTGCIRLPRTAIRYMNLIYYLFFFFFASHRTTLHRTTPYLVAPHRTTPHRIAPNRIALHRIAPNRTASNRTTPCRFLP